jgi:hypothetical protein
MRFLVDENVSPCLKYILEAWGHDADAVGLRGDLASEDDREIMRAAIREERILVTFNISHYENLHEECIATGCDHPGMVVCIQQEGYANFGRIVRWMENLLKTVPVGALPNNIYYLHTY